MPDFLSPPRAVGSPDSGAGLSIFIKADQALEAMGERGEPTVAEIAECIGEPKSSVYRLLGSLTSLGWVEKSHIRGRYRLGVTFIRLASAVMWHLDIRSVVAPALAGLHEATGETTFLCVRSGGNAVCIDRMEGTAVRSLVLRLGDSLPLGRGGAPLVLLAYAPDTERAELVGRLGGDADEKRRLLDRIDEVRMTGTAWSDEDVTPGIAACAGAVFDHRGDIMAAISVSGRRELLRERAEEVRASVRSGAATASWALGWGGDWPAGGPCADA
ncbi:IclR family transcriptional regulator [Corynebacterium pacaense]|uniref:IclR family transcriptional regulator n=1 Tax=Corynebacterium pacaense TaxID=1816684 RepID=UPI0009BA9401|nr:IclR family transcriptional regulator [Corynebacterium pacaense]